MFGRTPAGFGHEMSAYSFSDVQDSCISGLAAKQTNKPLCVCQMQNARSYDEVKILHNGLLSDRL